MSSSSSSIPTTLPAHYVLGTLELTENARTNPSPYNTFQTYLIEAAEQAKVFQNQVDKVIDKYELSYRTSWSISLNNQPMKLINTYYESAKYKFPESQVNNALGPILERFAKYSPHPQRKNQIYELFAILHCRPICKKMALDEHLIPDLQSIVQGYIGEGMDEFNTVIHPTLEITRLKDSLETALENTSESALANTFERALEEETVRRGIPPEAARRNAMAITLIDALQTALSSESETTRRYAENNFGVALQTAVTTAVPEISIRNPLGIMLKNTLEIILKNTFEAAFKDDALQTAHGAVGDFMLSNLPPLEFSLVEKVKLAALEASFKQNTRTDFSIDLIPL